MFTWLSSPFKHYVPLLSLYTGLWLEASRSLFLVHMPVTNQMSEVLYLWNSTFRPDVWVQAKTHKCTKFKHDDTYSESTYVGGIFYFYMMTSPLKFNLALHHGEHLTSGSSLSTEWSRQQSQSQIELSQGWWTFITPIPHKGPIISFHITKL